MKSCLPIAATLVAALTLSASAYASTSVSSFYSITTLQQAQAICATPTALVFTPDSPVIANGNGVVTGYSNGHKVAFTSTTQAPYPQSVNPSNQYINNASFRESNGAYGYISGQQITCFYVYSNFLGNPYFLNMSGKA